MGERICGRICFTEGHRFKLFLMICKHPNFCTSTDVMKKERLPLYFSLTKRALDMLGNTIMLHWWTVHTRQTSTDSLYFILLVWQVLIAISRSDSAFSRKRNKAITLGHYLTILTPETRPGVIVRDRELALMAALDKVFSSSSHLLCIWHINKTILAKCKRQF